MSPSTQVDSDEVGLSVMGIDIVGRDDGNEAGSGAGFVVDGIDVGSPVVGTDEIGRCVVGFAVGPPVVGSDEVGRGVVGVDVVG